MPVIETEERVASASKGERRKRTRTHMGALLHRVKEAGFSSEFARGALPSWWEDSMGESATGLAHGALFIARRLGLEVDSLLEADASVTLAPMGKVCFKTGLVAEALRPSTSVAISAARLMARALTMKFDLDALPKEARTLRHQLLKIGPVVNLDTVTAWCWDNGIPVLHLKKLPGRKPQALCLFHKARPYVFLCDGHNLSAWQVFHLLHELAHICLGHVNEQDSLCVDEKINRADTQTEEAQANAFAVEALLGDPSARVRADDRVTADVLAEQARALGVTRNLDPGALILNVFHHDSEKERVGRNMAAVKLLEPDPPAIHRIGVAAESRLDWDVLDEDNSEYLRCLLGLTENAEAAPAA